MSGLLSGDDEVPVSWPTEMPAPYGYLVARDAPPEPCGLVGDIVLDGAGLYLAAITEHLAVRVRLARAVIPDLPVVPSGVTLRQGPIDGSLWEALVARARAAMPNEVLLADLGLAANTVEAYGRALPRRDAQLARRPDRGQRPAWQRSSHRRRARD